ncbi:hypothetical protein H632_c510p0, partial [Helicosporidium sp. ATCC 50920]
VYVEQRQDAASGDEIVTVSLRAPLPNTPPYAAARCWRPRAASLCWGLYRASPEQWQHPKQVTPPGSKLDENTGSMVSPMTVDDSGATLTLRIPKSLVPLTLAFAVRVDKEDRLKTGSEVVPRFVVPFGGKQTHFSVPLGMAPGAPTPLGISLAYDSALAALDDDGEGANGLLQAHDASPAWYDPRTNAVNFAVRSDPAESVSLVLLRPPRPDSAQWSTVEVALDPLTNRTGTVWHVSFPLAMLGGKTDVHYAWRVGGDPGWDGGSRIVGDQLLLDPHAPLISYFDVEVASLAEEASAPAASLLLSSERLKLPRIRRADSGRSVHALNPLAAAHATLPALLSWPGGGANRRGTRARRGCVVELDLYGACLEAGAAEGAKPEAAKSPKLARTAEPSNGRRLVDGARAVARQVLALGADTVLVAPLYATGASADGVAPGCVSFLAPDPRFGEGSPRSALAAARNLRAVLRAVQQSGVRVVMGVDVARATERRDEEEGGDRADATHGLRGLDHKVYYRPDGSLGASSPALGDLLLEACVHWHLGYGVDGFAVLSADNACIDGRGEVQDGPFLAASLATHPLLLDAQFVACPGNAALLPREGARGFPHWGRWGQWDGRWAADAASFFRAEWFASAAGSVEALQSGFSTAAFLAGDQASLPLSLPSFVSIAASFRASTASASRVEVDAVPRDAPTSLSPTAFPVRFLERVLLGSWRDVAPAMAANALPGSIAAGRSAAQLWVGLSRICNFASALDVGAQGQAARALAEGSMPALETPPPLAKTLLLAALLSPSTPVLSLPDLASRPDLFRFVQTLLQLRSLLAPTLLAPPRALQPDCPRTLSWHDASEQGYPDWQGAEPAYVAARLAIPADAPDTDRPRAAYVGFNPHAHDVYAVLPPAPPGQWWAVAVDTHAAAPADARADGFEILHAAGLNVGPGGGVVLVARRID